MGGQAATSSPGGGLPGVVGLGRASGDHAVGSGGERLGQQEFELAGFVAAGGQPGLIVALDEQIGSAESATQVGQRVDRRGEVGQPNTGQGVKMGERVAVHRFGSMTVGSQQLRLTLYGARWGEYTLAGSRNKKLAGAKEDGSLTDSVTDSLFDEAARAFLQKPLIARVSVIDGDGYPHTVPVWFMLDGNDVVIISVRETRKVAYALENPKGAVAIGGDPADDGGYLIKGDFAIEPDPDDAWTRTLTHRYEEPEKAEQDIADWADLDMIVLRLKPKRVIKVA